MASYKVIGYETLDSDLRSIPFPFRREVVHALMRLKDSPRPVAAELFGDGYRLTLQGWSILYEIDDDRMTVTVLAVVR